MRNPRSSFVCLAFVIGGIAACAGCGTSEAPQEHVPGDPASERQAADKSGSTGQAADSSSQSRPKPTTSDIWEAAKRGHLEDLRIFLEDSTTVDPPDDLQRTPLIWAAHQGQTAAVEWLLDHGAEPNHNSHGNWTALHFAAKNGHVPVAEALLQRGANGSAATTLGDTPLDVAIQADKYEVADLLLQHGAKVPTHPNPRTSWLAIAVTDGNVERVRFLARQKLDLDKRVGDAGFTPLILATQAGKTEIARALLDAGADVNAASNAQWTALHYAVQQTRRETAQLLIDRGADVTARNNLGKTPLEMNPDLQLRLPDTMN